MNYQKLLQAMGATPWAMLPAKLTELVSFLQMKAENPSEELLTTLYQARADIMTRRSQAATNTSGAIAVLPMYGTIMHRGSIFGDFFGMMGGCPLDRFTAAFRQVLNDPNCRAIVIDVDSPGGQIDGVPELAAEIFAARGTKPIIAVCNTLNASAAYWISSAADEVVASPSSFTGSIGVFTTHADYSKALEGQGIKLTLVSAGPYKTEGNPYEPLSDEALKTLQSMVDSAYGDFVKAVATNRGVKVSAVRSGYGQGRVLDASAAVAAGLVDRVATLDQVLGKLGVSRGPNSVRLSAGSLKAAVDQCECDCAACQAGNCDACTADPCPDENCACDNPKAASEKALPAASEKATAFNHQQIEHLRRTLELAGL